MDKQIDRSTWQSFAERFSEANAGRPVTIELVGEVLGAAEMTDATPLAELDYDDKGEESILITVGAGGEETTHTVSLPAAIWLRSDRQGVDRALEIIAADDSKVILNFEDKEVR